MTAVDLRDPSTFPSRRVEAWKYTDLARVLRETPPSSPAVQIAPGGPFSDLGGEEIAFANGRAVGADAFVASGEQTLRLRFVSDAMGTGHSASVRIAVKPGAKLTLLESHEGAGAGYVANYRIDLDIPAGAEVTRVVLVEEPADSISVAVAHVKAAPGAVYRQTTITNGAKLQRQETHVSHGGEGTDVTLDGLYALSAERHADLTSIVRHGGLNGLTSQLTKGVVRDTARGVFQGKIVVERAAQQTDARQYHHGMLLEAGAEIFAKPELLIHADDVQCAHGNTAGGLDEAAKFYLRSRGVPEKQARAMLIEAFLVGAIPEGLPEAIDVELRERIATWLEAHA